MSPSVYPLRIRVVDDDEAVLQLIADAVTLPALADRVELAGVSDAYPDRAGRGVRRRVDLLIDNNGGAS